MANLVSAVAQICVAFTLSSGRSIPQVGLGVYQWFKERGYKKTDGWLVGDKIKMFGNFRTFDLLGWSKDYFYIDTDGYSFKITDFKFPASNHLSIRIKK